MKTFLLSLSLATASCFIPTASASAHEPFVVNASLGNHYAVFYRTCAREPWQFYGSFDCPDKAGAAARHLAHHGYETFVRHHHHH